MVRQRGGGPDGHRGSGDRFFAAECDRVSWRKGDLGLGRSVSLVHERLVGGSRGLELGFFHVFTTPGTYPYYCMVHSFPGGTFMNGVVEVIGPATATPTPTVTLTFTVAPTLTPTDAPTLTATAAPTSAPGTPVPTTTPLPGAAVPTLGPAGKLALAVGLVAFSLFLLSRRS